jgi:endonuclease-3
MPVSTRRPAHCSPAADTPEKMLALGEDRVRDYIKTIGLYRNKAKNVIALSQKLVDDFGGEVPRTARNW